MRAAAGMLLAALALGWLCRRAGLFAAADRCSWPLYHCPRIGIDPVRRGADVAPADSAAWWLPLNSPAARRYHSRGAGAQSRSGRSARDAGTDAGAGRCQRRCGAIRRLDLDASAGRQKYGAAFLGPEKLPPFTFYSVGSAVSYAFDFAGGVRRTVEQQRALAESQQHELEAAALAISGNVAHAGAGGGLGACTDRERSRHCWPTIEKNLKLVQDCIRGRQRQSRRRAQCAEPAGQRPDAAAAVAARAERGRAMRWRCWSGSAPASWTVPDFRLARISLPARCR